MAIRRVCALLALATATAPANGALEVDLTSPASLRSAAKLVAANLMNYYVGDLPGNTVGILPGPPPNGDYYWWEGGALWGTMVDYWHYTNETLYNKKTMDSLIHQSNEPLNDFEPGNWSLSLGNDDQGFWGMSAMLAAETKFPDPPADKPQWLALAQAVFNKQAHRWDDTHCGGGLRWQIPLSNNGYNYKNSIANAILFNMGARLARYTNNASYAEWSEKVWDWMIGVGYIDAEFNIYDGGHVEHNCTNIDLAQFSYTAGIFIQGLGFMHNFTNGKEPWESRLLALSKRSIEFFFPNGIAEERACELEDRVQCTTDMLSFKGYFARFLAQTVQVAPNLRDTIMPALRSSAAGMAKSCNPDGTCGFRWNRGAYDGMTGAGQQMNALGALMSLMVVEPGILPPVTNLTGGTSIGNPAGGGEDAPERILKPITTADRAGAGILTTIGLIGIIGTLATMSTTFGEGGKWFKR